MSHTKAILISVASTAVVVALIFRITAVRQLVTGTTATGAFNA